MKTLRGMRGSNISSLTSQVLFLAMTAKESLKKEGENEPVLETLVGICPSVSQTCLWRRKYEDAHLEIHDTGDSNDHAGSIRDRYQYPAAAWQWWEG